MTRKELYSHIKSLKLQDEVQAVCGDNYTRVSNYELEIIVNKALDGLKKCNKKSTNETKQLDRLIKILAKKNILLPSEIHEIMN